MQNGPAPLPSRFFRIIQGDQPNRWDFMSNEARGIPPRRPLTPRDRDLWRGVSYMATLESARERVQSSPWLGLYIAEIVVPSDAAIRVEQTTRHPLHYTLWADADAMLSWFVRLWSIDAVQ